MKTGYPIHGTNNSKTRGWFVDWYNQWPGLFSDSNWYDFTVVHLTGEYAPYKSCVEVQIGLLGFCVTITYVYRPPLGEEDAG
jgi:hypothetical protein